MAGPSYTGRAVIGWALLLAALTIGAYLRLTNYFGVMRVDSFNYVDVALALLRQEPIFDDAHLAIVVHAVRLTLILPMVPIFLLLGADERSATLWPLLCSLGSIALSWLIGRRLGGRLVGALSALIVAVYPIEVLLATQLLPDAVLACFVLVAVYAYMRADEPDEIGSVQRFALAGGALGLAYYARINAPVVLLFLLAYSAVRRRISVGLLGLAIGFLSVLALGELLFYLNGGVPLFGLTRHLRIVGVNPEFTRAPDWTAFVRMLWNNPLFRPWTLALVASLLPLMLLRPRRWWVGPLWLASTLLYLDVLSQWPTVSLPEKGDRMLTILAAPLALTIAMGAAAAVGRVPWATARGGLIVALAAAAVPLVALPGLRPIPAERQAFVEWRGRYVRQLADAVGALPRGDVQLVNDWRAWIALYRG
jgi:4-amino-4-deoxy-L-arabinose transferase-like glycosyltransferase